jgi:Flagellar biogenesis protein
MGAQLPLGPRKGLMVVRFLNKRLLLGVTEQQISLLTEEEASDGSQDSKFQDIMREASTSDAGADSGHSQS